MYKFTWKSPANGVVHIVAMPYSRPFSACRAHNLAFQEPNNSFVPGVATCVACWAREILEWEWETRAFALREGI